MSLAMKFEVLSEKVIVTSNVAPVAGFEEPLVIATVGAVPSYVHVYGFDTVLPLVPASLNALAATDTLGVPSLLAVHVAV
jgi:hypothetical protein